MARDSATKPAWPGHAITASMLRAASFVYTHKAVGELERVMRARKPAQSARRVVLFAMCLTGITLALMLWPPPPDSSVVAVNLVRGVVVIVVQNLDPIVTCVNRIADASCKPETIDLGQRIICCALFPCFSVYE